VISIAASEQERRWHGGVIATTVSALFLLVIGIANLFILKGVWLAFGRARRGEKIIDKDLDALLAGCGLLARIFRPVFRAVLRSWHMYPIGFLFGLGFDTATEIGLLGIFRYSGCAGYVFLDYPSLPRPVHRRHVSDGHHRQRIDDRRLRLGFRQPDPQTLVQPHNHSGVGRRAVFVGGVEIFGLIGDKLGLEGGFWSIIGGLNDNLANLGFAVVGIFVASWIVSTVIYRGKGFDNLQVGKT
jgi:nickel/cobalt transporter (NiCoT) family protein